MTHIIGLAIGILWVTASIVLFARTQWPSAIVCALVGIVFLVGSKERRK